MKIDDWLAVSGTVLQSFGAGYLVFTAWRTKRSLVGFEARQTIDGQTQAIVDLARQVAGQFGDQLAGFAFVLLGSALQVAAAIKLNF